MGAIKKKKNLIQLQKLIVPVSIFRRVYQIPLIFICPEELLVN